MTDEKIRAIVVETLRGIAPELDESDLRSDRPLREQVDLDSMDWLNFLVGLHQRLRVEIPETDYRKLTTLDAVVAYLAQKGV
ncbi:MAG: phosphopantetheine-binding protein [Betaproteobacteria bacterium RIFCSPLOWO2_12_FULL_63_13]|nr:MAG: phosphopantetheine-binding protein [Betaproteobacteria bacterium RIFCSPLOWO2_12_FULL_63_13]